MLEQEPAGGNILFRESMHENATDLLLSNRNQQR